MSEKQDSIIDVDFLIERRRNAYIECTENYLESNTVVGIFGDSLPEEIFYACNTVPVPIEGVDSHIFKFAKENETAHFCDVIKSTLTYLTTQKCPILYSCKMYVVENTCKKFIDALKANTEKPVLVYREEAELINKLCSIYGTQYNEEAKVEARADLDYIKNVLEKIKYHSCLNTKEVFLLEFYSKYMTDLKMRKEYFEELEKNIEFIEEKNKIVEVATICPRGGYESLCKEINIPIARIVRTWNGSEYGYKHCPFDFKKEINY